MTVRNASRRILFTMTVQCTRLLVGQVFNLRADF
jgi:hypothetical protein